MADAAAVQHSQAQTLQAALRAEDRPRMALTAAEGFQWQAGTGAGDEVALRATSGLARRIGLAEGCGYPRKALLTRVHEADRGSLCELLDRIRKGAPSLPDPICRFALPGGTRAWVKIVHDPSSRDSDASRRISRLAFDISDEQGAGQDLAEVIAGGEPGDWRLDPLTGVNQINDRWAKIIGYTRVELGQVTLTEWRKMVHPEDLARMERSHATGITVGNSFFSNDIRTKHKAGHWVRVLSRGRAVEFAANGKVRIHVDIARRKALEGALRCERASCRGWRKPRSRASWPWTRPDG